MEVHDMLLAALGAKAFDFRFVMVDHDIRIVVDRILGWFP
jgi:hypothetical protein